jgi:hypothetical protein
MPALNRRREVSGSIFPADRKGAGKVPGEWEIVYDKAPDVLDPHNYASKDPNRNLPFGAKSVKGTILAPKTAGYLANVGK